VSDEWPDLIERLRHYHSIRRLSPCHEAADEIERLRREAESFHMDYRMKCDEETKRLHVDLARLSRELAERDVMIANLRTSVDVLFRERGEARDLLDKVETIASYDRTGCTSCASIVSLIVAATPAPSAPPPAPDSALPR
jgi:hypothetical protein